MLIEAMGQKLSHQPFEWKSWWWELILGFQLFFSIPNYSA